MVARLQEQYRTKIVPSLRKSLGRENVHSLPRLLKVIISMGVGKATEDRKLLDEVMDQLAQIAGQKPQRTKSRKAVAAFRLRERLRSKCATDVAGDSVVHIWTLVAQMAEVHIDRSGTVKSSSDIASVGRMRPIEFSFDSSADLNEVP